MRRASSRGSSARCGRDAVAPDDPGAVRELRFRFGEYHIVVTASPDGAGRVDVIDDFYRAPDVSVSKLALASTLAMLSIARKWVFDAYLKAGGTVEELRQAAEADRGG